MAYGTVGDVADLAKIWTNNGEFLDPDLYDNGATNPTLSTVERWIDKVSASMDVALSNQGFIVPVEVPTAVETISLMVVSLVTDLVNNANSSGRFHTEKAVERGQAPMVVIRKDLTDWVVENTPGLVNLGVPRIENAATKTSAVFDVL